MAVNCDSIQVYEGLEVLSGAAAADERERLEHRLLGVRAGDGGVQRRPLRGARPREIDACSPRAAADRGRRHRPLPAGRPGRAGAAPARARGCARGGRGDLAERGVPRPFTPSSTGDLAASRPPERPQAHLAADRAASGWASTRTPRPRGCGRSGRATRRAWSASPSSATSWPSASTPGSTRWSRGGAEPRSRAADAAGASRTARAAIGFDELLAGDVEAMKSRPARLARRQLTWMRQMPGVEHDRPRRALRPRRRRRDRRRRSV